MAKHHIVYIPGLGDRSRSLLGQRLIIALWQAAYGVSTELVRIGWADNTESFDDKLQRVLSAIDKAKSKGYVVSIVSASAGSSMAIHAYAARSEAIWRMISIVGAHGPASHASHETLTSNPALNVSLIKQPAALQALTAENRGHILGVKPLEDKVIRLSDMNIPGIQYLQLSTRGHVATIAAALTIHSPKLIAFIKHPS